MKELYEVIVQGTRNRGSATGEERTTFTMVIDADRVDDMVKEWKAPTGAPLSEGDALGLIVQCEAREYQCRGKGYQCETMAFKRRPAQGLK